MALRTIRQTRSGTAGPALIYSIVAGAAVALSACASLPTSAPTMHQVAKEYRSGQTIVRFTLVPLDAVSIREAPPPPIDPSLSKMVALARDPGPERADVILAGDTLNISIFEVGVSLFGAGAPTTVTTVPRTPTAGAQVINPEVREDGFITLPYVGQIMAAGVYPEDLATLIRRRLKPFSENPEVSVAIAASVKNAVYLGGPVVKPGRYRLTAAHEHLLDLLALAGGSAIDANELEVRLLRGKEEIDVPLNRINLGDPANLVLHPGDRIQFVRTRPSYTVFGASDRVSQVFFESKDLSLAEAIARAAGPSDYRANPRGVFVCRYLVGSDGKLDPMVYQLNMMKTDAYFLAQRFPMRDKDVILFANASGTITQKLVGLLGNLFAPVATVRYAAQ